MVQATEPSTTIELPRFGTCSYQPSEVITFPWGLPGFVSLRRFLAIVREGQEDVIWLQSLEDLGVALPMADPWVFFPEYDPKLPLYAQKSLNLEAPEDFVVMGILVIPNEGTQVTINLLAPVVINLKTKIARQVPLESGGYAVRTALPVEVAKALAPAETIAE